MGKKLFFNWSSGKDSALAYYFIQQKNEYSIEYLVTVIGKESQRVSLHGLHRNVLEQQLKALGKPYHILELPDSSTMALYNSEMKKLFKFMKAQQIEVAAFGDIFLEDLKNYRESQLNKVGMKAHFTLWNNNTRWLMQQFLNLGFKSVIVSANAKWFSKEFVGSELTLELIDNLPQEVDACGENGEFHTFCYDGPIFKQAVDFELGEKSLHTYPDPLNKGSNIHFWFCDILLAE